MCLGQKLDHIPVLGDCHQSIDREFEKPTVSGVQWHGMVYIYIYNMYMYIYTEARVY